MADYDATCETKLNEVLDVVHSISRRNASIDQQIAEIRSRQAGMHEDMEKGIKRVEIQLKTLEDLYLSLDPSQLELRIRTIESRINEIHQKRDDIYLERQTENDDLPRQCGDVPLPAPFAANTTKQREPQNDFKKSSEKKNQVNSLESSAFDMKTDTVKVDAVLVPLLPDLKHFFQSMPRLSLRTL